MTLHLRGSLAAEFPSRAWPSFHITAGNIHASPLSSTHPGVQHPSEENSRNETLSSVLFIP